MSSEILSAAPPRRRYGWIIAVAIIVAIVVLIGALVVHFAQPLKFGLSFLEGNPTIPGCRTTVVAENTVGPLWNRIVDMNCRTTTMHIVFVKRTSSGMPFVMPAVMSIDGPAATSVRQTGDNEFEVVLAAPLADGRTSVPIKLNKNGVVTELQSFNHGKLVNAKPSLMRG